MPAHRKPTAVLEAAGAFKLNPDRGRDRALEPQGVGELGGPPDWLQPELVNIWLELSAVLPKGVGTATDRQAFSVLCRYTVEQRTLGMLESKDASQYLKLLSVFGMTPADRSRIKLPPQVEEENAFAGLRRIK
jgi:phage terminase small subunit